MNPVMTLFIQSTVSRIATDEFLVGASFVLLVGVIIVIDDLGIYGTLFLCSVFIYGAIDEMMLAPVLHYCVLFGFLFFSWRLFS